MTLDDLATYYANLLIFQYSQKPKAFATIKALVTPVFMDQLPLQVQNAYNLEDAAGVQLDVLGKYVGVARVNATTNGLVSLNDDDFRTLIRLVLLKNNAGSSLATIQNLLAMNFPGKILVSDNQTMQLSYSLLPSLGSSDLLDILTSSNYLPAPMAVATSVIVIPSHSNPFFGFTSYGGSLGAVSPFNSYPFYQTTYPWFTYGG